MLIWKFLSDNIIIREIMGKICRIVLLMLNNIFYIRKFKSYGEYVDGFGFSFYGILFGGRRGVRRGSDGGFINYL